MEELIIERQRFEKERKQLEKYSKETTTDVELKRVNSDKGGGEYVWGLLSGEGFGTKHIVKGAELNSLTSQIQTHLIGINEIQKSLIKEFGQVYTTLEVLDKDIINAIMITLKSAQEANGKAQIAQDDIQKTIEEQKKIIKVLQQFKEKISEHEHIGDIDNMWGDLQKQKKTIERLNDNSKKQKETLDKNNKLVSDLFAEKETRDQIVHLYDIDQIWSNLEESSNQVVEISQQIGSLGERLHSQEDELNLAKNNLDKLHSQKHIYEIESIWKDANTAKKKTDNLTAQTKECITSIEEANIRIKSLEQQLEAVNKKSELQDVELESNKKIVRKLDSQKHIYELDTVWQDVGGVKKKLENNITATQKCIESIEMGNESLNKLSEEIIAINSIPHLTDLNFMFEECTRLKNNVESLTLNKSRLEEQNNNLAIRLDEEQGRLENLEGKVANKLKTAYALAGGAAGIAIIELIFEAMRIL